MRPAGTRYGETSDGTSGSGGAGWRGATLDDVAWMTLIGNAAHSGRLEARNADHQSHTHTHMETYKCNDCNGTGVRFEFANVFNGVCFTCNGQGRIKLDINAKRPVVIKQHVLKTEHGFDLNFNFWNTGEIQVIKMTDEGSEGVRSVNIDQARNLWKNPKSF